MAKERGWPPITRARYDAQLGPEGALLIGNADEVVAKIRRHSDALGGISRITFQMNAASLPQAKLLQAIETLGSRVAPALRGELAASPASRVPPTARRRSATARVSGNTATMRRSSNVGAPAACRW